MPIISFWLGTNVFTHSERHSLRSIYKCFRFWTNSGQTHWEYRGVQPCDKVRFRGSFPIPPTSGRSRAIPHKPEKGFLAGKWRKRTFSASRLEKFKRRRQGGDKTRLSRVNCSAEETVSKPLKRFKTEGERGRRNFLKLLQSGGNSWQEESVKGWNWQEQQRRSWVEVSGDKRRERDGERDKLRKVGRRAAFTDKVKIRIIGHTSYCL